MRVFEEDIRDVEVVREEMAKIEEPIADPDDGRPSSDSQRRSLRLP